MIDQTGQSETFDAFFTASGVGKTGLTDVSVTVYGPAGGAALVTGQAATEIGGGLYSYTLAASHTTTAGNYRALFATADTTVDAKQLAALWVAGKPWTQSLPGVAPGSAGGLLTQGTGAGQLATSGGAVYLAVDPWSIVITDLYPASSAGGILFQTLESIISQGGLLGTLPNLGEIMAGVWSYDIVSAAATTTIPGQAAFYFAYQPKAPAVNSNGFRLDTLDSNFGATQLAGYQVQLPSGQLFTIQSSDGEGNIVLVGGWPEGQIPAIGLLYQIAAPNYGGPVALASSGLDAIQVEPGVNPRQALSAILAFAAGQLAGAGTTGPIVISAGAHPSVPRISAVTDADGNRTSVTLALPD